MSKRIFGVAVAALLAVTWTGAAASASAAKTVWLCKPGQSPDPCTPGLSTTVYSPTLKQTGVQHPSPVSHPAIDCFYVYPTVSDQTTGNANLHVDPEERSVALYQAARYSQYCRVFAPMYRQITIVALGQGALGKPTTKPDVAPAFADLQNAFETYLHRYNQGRGFVLIGQSQGAFFLRTLIAQDIDSRPAVRKLLVSAILMGGNVLVKDGKDIGGDFKRIPACRSATELRCVIAFSTFDQPPPNPSFFGRPTALFGTATPSGDVVLCTNPAALGGGSGLLDPVSPSAPFAPGTLISEGIAGLKYTAPTAPTPWWTAPNSYRARCETLNGATVLEITPVGGAPTPTPSPTPAWGLHLVDANIALGNLISIVKREAAAFVASGR